MTSTNEFSVVRSRHRDACRPGLKCPTNALAVVSAWVPSVVAERYRTPCLAKGVTISR
jgi:hypothetical protein